MGYEFKVMVADIDEKAVRFGDPKKLTLALAKAKADALLPKIREDAILITADQVIICNGVILEKPRDAREAEEFLRGYNKYPAEAVTAVVALNTANKKRSEGVDIAKVYFRPLAEEKIRKWAASNVVLTCAGGFCINDPSFKEADFYERVEGDIDSVAGLPKALTERLIKEVQS
ncbi:MAG: septum formation protein [Parcubacteria group bacterium Gr01-1014_30]|nr:MAG: septum formation protein [Parcubacteria group bacterium Gr01-1014_30]